MENGEALNIPSLAVERLWTISLMDEIVPFLRNSQRQYQVFVESGRRRRVEAE
jgi:hypothetical protein